MHLRGEAKSAHISCHRPYRGAELSYPREDCVMVEMVELGSDFLEPLPISFIFNPPASTRTCVSASTFSVHLLVSRLRLVI